MSRLGQASGFQFSNDKVGFTKEQSGLGVSIPTLSGGLVGWMQSMGGIRQMLTSVIPIHDLNAVGKVVGSQIPNPGGPIRRNGRVGSLGNSTPDRQSSQGWPKLFNRT